MVELIQINEFAKKWISKFEDPNVDYIELVDHYFADDCRALGFAMDCGHAYNRKYPGTVGGYDHRRDSIANESNIALLGSAVYSQWRYFNHWAYDGAEILEQRNRDWFCKILRRLEELSNSPVQGYVVCRNIRMLDDSGEIVPTTIMIKKQGITDLAVDAIVNAANEGLMAGGGVCGDIFRAAGHTELQNACDKIGHCDTGNAVMTAGFALKAKCVIHAVGPVWHGGNNDEKKLLYSCYEKSLELAEKTGLHTIAFPLISAGIFGVPVDVAWRKAIQAVSEYQTRHPESAIEVIFAVLDDGIMAEGIKCVDSILTE